MVFKSITGLLPAIASLGLLLAGLITAERAVAAESATRVVTASLDSIAIYPRISASATTISLENASVSAQISGQIKEVVADVGQQVKKGQVILSLNCDDYQFAKAIARGQYDAAVANKKLAESRNTRSLRLLQQKLTSQQDVDATTASFDAASAEVNRSKAALDQASLNVQRCQVVAPFSGVITARRVSRGDYATVDMSLFSIVNHEVLEVSARVSEQDIESLSGNTAFTFQSIKGYDVTLARVVEFIDPATRTQEIRLLFDQDKPLPGTAGKVVWHSSVPHLPAKYMTSRRGQPGYFIVVDNIARFQVVVGGFVGRDQPYNGSRDAQIIISNLNRLADGDRVEVSRETHQAGQ